jgi:hypothetical protein
MTISKSITVLSVLVIACVFIRFTFELEYTVDYLVIVAGVGAQIIEKRGCDTMENQSRNIAACNAVPHPIAHRVSLRQWIRGLLVLRDQVLRDRVHSTVISDCMPCQKNAANILIKTMSLTNT